MRTTLHAIATGKTYWLSLISLGIALEGVALLYQYAWNEPPCVICIHVRLLVAAFILLAGAALFIRRYRFALVGAHALNTVIIAWLLERAWLLLGTERGTVIASCSMDLEMPPWLAFDQWLPALFQVQSLCGYTPELLFGITMAEGLTVMSALLVLVSAILMVTTLLKKT